MQISAKDGRRKKFTSTVSMPHIAHIDRPNGMKVNQFFSVPNLFFGACAQRLDHLDLKQLFPSSENNHMYKRMNLIFKSIYLYFAKYIRRVFMATNEYKYKLDRLYRHQAS